MQNYSSLIQNNFHEKIEFQLMANWFKGEKIYSWSRYWLIEIENSTSKMDLDTKWKSLKLYRRSIFMPSYLGSVSEKETYTFINYV